MHLSVHPLQFCITIVFDFSYDEGDHLCRHSTLTNVWVTTQGSARLYNIKKCVEISVASKGVDIRD